MMFSLSLSLSLSLSQLCNLIYFIIIYFRFGSARTRGCAGDLNVADDVLKFVQSLAHVLAKVACVVQVLRTTIRENQRCYK